MNNKDKFESAGFGKAVQSQLVVSESNNLQQQQAPEEPIFKGCLVKRNWYGNKQLREFHLFQSGEIVYYAIGKDNKPQKKGCFFVTPTTKLDMVDDLTLNLFCQEKNRTYFLQQPQSSKVDFNE